MLRDGLRDGLGVTCTVAGEWQVTVRCTPFDFTPYSAGTIAAAYADRGRPEPRLYEFLSLAILGAPLRPRSRPRPPLGAALLPRPSSGEQVSTLFRVVPSQQLSLSSEYHVSS